MTTRHLFEYRRTRRAVGLRWLYPLLLIVALIGSTLGLILALIAVPILSNALTGVLPALVLSPQILFAGLPIALLVGVADGWIPGILAMRMRVISALRKV